MKRYFVYILLCSDNSYYVGMTNDLDRRFNEHQSGFYPQGFTFSRRPVRLAWFTDFGSKDQAFSFERQLKGWSRRKKKALIEGRIGALKYFSRSAEGMQRRRNRGKLG